MARHINEKSAMEMIDKLDDGMEDNDTEIETREDEENGGVVIFHAIIELIDHFHGRLFVNVTSHNYSPCCAA